MSGRLEISPPQGRMESQLDNGHTTPSPSPGGTGSFFVEGVHLMPCEIEFDGTAEVGSSLLNEGNYDAAFRGRPIKGENLSIPEGYSGIVMHEPRRPFMEDEERTFRIKHRFDELTYWNLDIPPNADDKIKKAFAWIDIAKAVHRPIDVASSQKSLPGK